MSGKCPKPIFEYLTHLAIDFGGCFALLSYCALCIVLHAGDLSNRPGAAIRLSFSRLIGVIVLVVVGLPLCGKAFILAHLGNAVIGRMVLLLATVIGNWLQFTLRVGSTLHSGL